MDGGANGLQLFDPDGTFLRQLGRQGEGPGEFLVMMRVRQCDGEGIFIQEEAKSIMNIFEVDGQFREQFRLFTHNPNRPPYSWDCSDGRFATLGWGSLVNRPPGPFRPAVAVAVAGADGQLIRTLGWILGPGQYANPRGGGGPEPLGVAIGFALSGDRLFISGGPEFRLDAIRLDGTREWTLSSSILGDRVDRDAYLGSIRPDDATEDEMRTFEARWLDRELPTHLPALRGLLVDAVGNIWIEQYPAPYRDDDVRWFVVSPDGEWLAQVFVHAGMEVKSIGTDHLLGILTDDLGVQRVARFDLTKDH